MMSKYITKAVPTLAGGLFLSLSATAMHQDQMQQQQGRQCYTIPTPQAAPCVTSCALKNHVTTYEMGNGGKVIKHVVKTTECQLTKGWEGASKHSDTLPIEKVGGCSTNQQQITAQQTCSPLAVTPMALCVEQDIAGDSHAKLIKKDYYTYEMSREGGAVKVVTHNCNDDVITVEEFLDGFVDSSDISLDDAIRALDTHLALQGQIVITKSEMMDSKVEAKVEAKIEKMDRVEKISKKSHVKSPRK